MILSRKDDTLESIYFFVSFSPPRMQSNFVKQSSRCTAKKFSRERITMFSLLLRNSPTRIRFAPFCYYIPFARSILGFLRVSRKKNTSMMIPIVYSRRIMGNRRMELKKVLRLVGKKISSKQDAKKCEGVDPWPEAPNFPIDRDTARKHHFCLNWLVDTKVSRFSHSFDQI